jgi:hypothetical protein
MSRFYIVHLDVAEHRWPGRGYTGLLQREARWANIQDASIATYWW